MGERVNPGKPRKEAASKEITKIYKDDKTF
jgi:hypothetical protein